MKYLISALPALVFVFLAAQPLPAAEKPESFYSNGNWRIYGNSPHYLDIGAGLFDVDIGGSEGNEPAAHIQFRLGRKLWFIGPAVGFLANLDGGYYGYGGIYGDFAWKRLILTPVLAAGAYEDGGGKDLGGTFQFRLSLQAAYQFDNLSRLGIEFGHISSAGINDYNPGEQEVYLSFSWPF